MRMTDEHIADLVGDAGRQTASFAEIKQQTARLLAAELGLEDKQWRTCFQSRFGRQEWLKPYSDETLKAMPAEGIKSVDVFCPGFPADCLETLEEMAMQNKAVFQQAGGGDYRYIPALNDAPEHIEALADIVMQNLQGWPGIESWDVDDARNEAELRARRAKELGAV